MDYKIGTGMGSGGITRRPKIKLEGGMNEREEIVVKEGGDVKDDEESQKENRKSQEGSGKRLRLADLKHFIVGIGNDGFEF